jgi:hypothetical protein
VYGRIGQNGYRIRPRKCSSRVDIAAPGISPPLATAFGLVTAPGFHLEARLTSLGPDRETRGEAGLAHLLRALVVLTITVLFASSARSDAYINAFLRAQAASVVLSEDKTTANVTVAVANSTAAPYSLVFLSAVLKDDRGHFFTLAARPTGIATGRPSTCEAGVILEPGASLSIGLSFKVFSRLPPDTTTLRLSAEFQAQRHTCESFTVSLNNLSVLN